MPSSRRSIAVATAALLGLAFPPTVMAASTTLAMPLCGGGTVQLAIGGKGRQDGQGACHIACAARRDDDGDEPT